MINAICKKYKKKFLYIFKIIIKGAICIIQKPLLLATHVAVK